MDHLFSVAIRSSVLTLLLLVALVSISGTAAASTYSETPAAPTDATIGDRDHGVMVDPDGRSVSARSTAPPAADPVPAAPRASEPRAHRSQELAGEPSLSLRTLWHFLLSRLTGG